MTPREVAAGLMQAGNLIDELIALGIKVSNVEIGAYTRPVITVFHSPPCEALKTAPDGYSQSYDHKTGVVIMSVRMQDCIVMWWERLTQPNLISIH